MSLPLGNHHITDDHPVAEQSGDDFSTLVLVGLPREMDMRRAPAPLSTLAQ